MALEIEAKMKVEEHGVLAARLEERGARLVGSFFETNAFFDTEDRRLLAADRGLRLRTSRDEGTGKEKFVITHKGPGAHGALKIREETEVSVEDGRAATRLLEKLGYGKTLTFEKRRQSWKFGACSVELDEVPILGHFVEIEGPDEVAVMHAREALGMDNRPIIKAGYVAMLTAHLQERGERLSEIKF